MKDFSSWIKDKNLPIKHVGTVVVFYIPKYKLNNIKFGFDGKSPKKMFQEFFLTNFSGFTLSTEDSKGFWRSDKNMPIVKDDNIRYEISIEGHENIAKVVNFLSTMCKFMKEDAIYVVVGEESFLVKSKLN